MTGVLLHLSCNGGGYFGRATRRVAAVLPEGVLDQNGPKWSERRDHFSGGKTTNKHQQPRGIVPEMGGGQIVYVFRFYWKKGST